MNMSKSVLVKGRNQETARALLDSAKRLGLGPEVVKTSSLGGYLVPEEVHAGLGDAPGEEFTESVEIRTQALAGDETAAEGPNESPESVVDGPGEGSPLGAGRVDRPAQTAVVQDGEQGGDEKKAPRGRRSSTTDAKSEETD